MVSMPAPPYSSGTATPASPSSPAWSKKARGNSRVSSISLARGLTTSSANRRTVSCSSFCSSLSSIFMAFLFPRSLAGRECGRPPDRNNPRPASQSPPFESQSRRHEDDQRSPLVHRDRNPQLPAHRLGPDREPRRHLGPQEERLARPSDRRRGLRLAAGGRRGRRGQARPPRSPAPSLRPPRPRAAGLD